MHAVIHNFRRSIKTTSGNQMIVIADGITTKEKAKSLIGKKVVYSTGKKEITGEVRSSHGNKGALRVLFETGMPGQAIGKHVTIR